MPWQYTGQEFLNRVVFIPNVGFYSLPKIMGRTGHFINDGLRLISFGLQVKTKKHKHCVKAQDCFGRNSRPPTASQWAAVRIKAYWVDRGNPQATPDQDFSRKQSILVIYQSRLTNTNFIYSFYPPDLTSFMAPYFNLYLYVRASACFYN